MATETVPNTSDGLPLNSDVLAEARDRTMLCAAREAGALAAMLRRETADIAECSDSEYLLPGCLMRIEALGSALAILAGCGRDRAVEIADQYLVVFGKPLEVSHG